MNETIEANSENELLERIAEALSRGPERSIRSDVKEALEAYAYRGLRLGDFLTAVVENDLFEALGRADSYNRETIYQIASFVYNNLPFTCWGSPEKVRAHYDSFRVRAEAERRTQCKPALQATYEEYVEQCKTDGRAVRYSAEQWVDMRMQAAEAL